MIWLGIVFALMVITPVWEWKREKLPLEKEVVMLRWEVLVLALAGFLFAAQAQIRLERLSSQLLSVKSTHELAAKP
jgi:hypothetical protein